MRTFFPTQNSLGVRTLNPIQTLGYYYDGFRAPAEPPARPNQNPVSLGTVTPSSVYPTGPFSQLIMAPSQGQPGAPMVYSLAVPQYGTPTPQFVAPATLPPQAILVTSGGGTVSPAPAPAAPITVTTPASSPGMMDQVASWLSGSTAIGSYQIPNALLAGVVAITGMFLMGGKRR